MVILLLIVNFYVDFDAVDYHFNSLVFCYSRTCEIKIDGKYCFY